MISIKNVGKQFQHKGQTITALKDINLDVKPREIFGIIGRSGAGKSTLIRCVNHLESPTSGAVYIAGKCITTMNPSQLRLARRKMGMIFQHFNLLQSRNVFDNIALPLELDGLSKSQIKARVDELLALTELENHVKQFPSQLSGGQKQRVAIARALANSPDLLLSDEATSALDPSSTHRILELLRTINHELGITILLITHEMDVVKTICHRVAVISQGEIVEQSPVIALFTNPKTAVAKMLVNAASRMEIPRVFKEKLQPSPGKSSGMIVRIAYVGDATSKPIIGYLIQAYGVTINILQGNIETIQDQIVGTMIVEMRGNEDSILKSMQFLEKNELHVEILGYVE